MAIGNPPPDTLAQATTPDPLVMYLVVRRELPATLDLLVSAAAQATVRVDRTFGGDPAWASWSAAWKTGSYRKVTLRASERDWAKLLESHPHARANDDSGEPLIVALPPRPRSTACRLLRDLQAYNPDASALPRRLPPLPPEPWMLIVPNPHVPMSGGKLLAQVGHAALMAADLPADWAAGRLQADAGQTPDQTAITAWSEAIAGWEAAEMPILPTFVDIASFRRLEARADAVVVTDSGLTEVAPGSRTVLAVCPASAETAAILRREIARG